MTNIPVEWLFGALGALVSFIYLDLRRAVNQLQRGSTFRDRLLTLICDKLKIPFNPGE